MSKDLNADKAFIFRIVHIANLDWIIENGLHCQNSSKKDPNFVNIGSSEIISRRNQRIVTCEPGGTLSDYVPFYFTPWSIMAYNIHTGYYHPEIPRRHNKDIIILVSSIHRLEKLDVPFVYTDRHALPITSQFFNDSSSLNHIDWGLLQRKDFSKDPEDPDKLERYQAEALIYRDTTLDSLLGINCYNDSVAGEVWGQLDAADIDIKVVTKKNWYF